MGAVYIVSPSALLKPGTGAFGSFDAEGPATCGGPPPFSKGPAGVLVAVDVVARRPDESRLIVLSMLVSWCSDHPPAGCLLLPVAKGKAEVQVRLLMPNIF